MQLQAHKRTTWVGRRTVACFASLKGHNYDNIYIYLIYALVIIGDMGEDMIGYRDTSDLFEGDIHSPTL